VYQVQLTAEQQQELRRRAHAPHVLPRTRDRLEMVRLNHAGFGIPRIACLLTISEQRVRYWIKAFLAGGFDALADQPHRGQASAFTPEIEAALRQEIATGEQTWTAPQVAAWAEEQFGLHLSRDHWSFLLRRAGLSYKRTTRSLKHKQDPAEVAQRQEALGALEKRGP
jgi:transposase